MNNNLNTMNSIFTNNNLYSSVLNNNIFNLNNINTPISGQTSVPISSHSNGQTVGSILRNILPTDINTFRNDIFSQLNINNENIDTSVDIIIALTDEEFNKIENIDINDLQIDTKCNICLDCFDKSSNILKLKCGHSYDYECIENWLKKHSNKCPICRDEVSKGTPINL